MNILYVGYAHEMELKKLISSNFKRLRANSGLTQAKIAEACGVGIQQIKDVENGRAKPSVDLLYRMAGVLRVSSGDLLEDPANVIPLHGNQELRKYMLIPDEVIEGFFDIAGDAQIWEMVKAAILLRKKAIQDEKKKQGKA